jgi:hypothetical protein
MPVSLVIGRLVALTLTLACSGQASAEAMLRLDYLDTDPDAAPYPTRMLVFRDWLRIDDGVDGGDFILLDRKQRRVYNVIRGERSIARFDDTPVKARRPEPWKVEEQVEKLPGKTVRTRISVNGVVCSRITAAQGQFPGAVVALGALKDVMRGVQIATWERTPVELRDHCDLAQQVWEYPRELKHGLPIEEAYRNGRLRQLQSHAWIKARPELFSLPTGFREQAMRDLIDF